MVSVFDKNASYMLQSRKSKFLNSLAGILPDFRVDYPESYKKWEIFFQSINIKEELPEIPEISSKQEKIFLAGRNILADFYAIKSEEVILKKYKIYAPFDGAFTEVMLEVGSVANPGSRIARIFETGQLELEVPIETGDSKWIKVGDKVIINSELGNKITEGIIIRKSPFVDLATQSFNVFVSVKPTNSNPVYKGQYMHAIFPGKIIKNAMEIPRNAVFNANEVFIVENGHLLKRDINILKINKKTIIFRGLQEDIDLIIEPLANATENMSVDIFGREKTENDSIRNDSNTDILK